MRQAKVVLTSLLLLTLFATYQVSITMFTHVHYVNGVMIMHSHPNQGKHSHTKTEVVVIDRLASFHTLEAEVSVFVEPLRPLLCYLEVPVAVSDADSTHLQVLSLRAPPIF